MGKKKILSLIRQNFMDPELRNYTGAAVKKKTTKYAVVTHNYTVITRSALLLADLVALLDRPLLAERDSDSEQGQWIPANSSF